MRIVLLLLTFAGLSATVVPAFAQTGPAAAANDDPLASLDGEWRGPATLTLPSGSRTVIQTERAGRMLGGAVRVIEGHSYNPDGSEGGFNALGIVSHSDGGGYEFRTYAQGRSGTFPMTFTPGGFEWVMPAGPGGAVRYTAHVTGGKWHEEGWYERDGRKLSKVYDATLDRIGDSAWPATGGVRPR